MKRKALGRGLDALLPRAPAAAGLIQCDVDQIRPNSLQPRMQFEPDKLAELAASIQENGIIQPVIVRQTEGGFELVAGERRWRAAQQAGLERIPAIVKELSDEKMLELALVENIQRDELSAVEEAHAYQLLTEEFSLSQEDVARRVGRSRTAVTNTLRLLRLPKNIQQSVVTGELGMGHARALLPLPQGQQLKLFQEILKRGLSVRQVETRVRHLLKPARKPPRLTDPNRLAAQHKLETQWKTQVEIRQRGSAGQIVFHFSSEEELERLYEGLLNPDTP